jgi:hypothetical protein
MRRGVHPCDAAVVVAFDSKRRTLRGRSHDGSHNLLAVAGGEAVVAPRQVTLLHFFRRQQDNLGETHAAQLQGKLAWVEAG